MNGAFDILLQKEKRGARVQATVTGEHYRRSLLVQGGLEVPCIVTVTMPGSIMNLFMMAQYEELLGELYLKPKDGEIMGRFLSVIRENDFVGTNQCTPREASPSTKNKKKAEVRSRDIFRKEKQTMWYSCNRLGFGNVYLVFWMLCLFYPLYLINLAFFAGINFREFQWQKNFAGINFREFSIEKYFAGIWFRENGQKMENSQKNVPVKISTPKVIKLFYLHCSCKKVVED